MLVMMVVGVALLVSLWSTSLTRLQLPELVTLCLSPKGFLENPEVN